MRRWLRRDGERGAVLVEMVLVILPLMTILLGMVEVGGAWRDKSSAIQASRAGVRVGASSSIVPTDVADQQILLSVLAGLPPGSGAAASPELKLRKVIIYDASLITDAALDTCKSVGESNPETPHILPSGPTGAAGPLCNVYLAGNDLASGLPSAQQDAVADATNYASWTRTFTARSQDITSVAGPTRIGVYVELHRPWVTGFFPGEGLTISGFSVMQAEPALIP